MATDLRWGWPSRLKSPTGCSAWWKRISAMASEPVAPMARAASTALASAGTRGVLQEPQHLDELAGAPVPEIGLQAPAQGGEASRQLPVLERPGEVDGTGLSLQEGQVVNGIEGRVLLAPVTAVPGDDLGPARDGDVFDPAE